MRAQVLERGQPGVDLVRAEVARPTAALDDYNPEELAELFDDFDIEATYNKAERTLQLAATLALEPPPKNAATARTAVAEFRHSGGRI